MEAFLKRRRNHDAKELLLAGHRHIFLDTRPVPPRELGHGIGLFRPLFYQLHVGGPFVELDDLCPGNHPFRQLNETPSASDGGGAR